MLYGRICCFMIVAQVRIHLRSLHLEILQRRDPFWSVTTFGRLPECSAAQETGRSSYFGVGNKWCGGVLRAIDIMSGSTWEDGILKGLLEESTFASVVPQRSAMTSVLVNTAPRLRAKGSTSANPCMHMGKENEQSGCPEAGGACCRRR